MNLRPSPGSWEEVTNRQQRLLERTYKTWSMDVRKSLKKATLAGLLVPSLNTIFEAKLNELKDRLISIVQQGVDRAARASAKSRFETDLVQSVVSMQKDDIAVMVTASLIPNIHAKLLPTIATGQALNSQLMIEGFGMGESLISQYSGAAWVTIFEVQKSLGLQREAERLHSGGEIEPVRWVLDPMAEHCQRGSDGYFGCPELEGEYPGGWYTLPTVPAGKVTCRGNAVLPGNIIDSNDVELAARLSYTGPALKLITQGGVEIAITANHPVLTPKGWLRAKSLNEGDYVINSTFSKTPMIIVNDYHKDVPALIEKIWDTFAVVSGIYTSPLSPIMADDFHGDGRFLDGDVKIVFPDSQLRDKTNSNQFQSGNDSPFSEGLLATRPLTAAGSFMKINRASLATADSRMIRSDLVNPLFGRHFRPLKLFGFALSPKVNSLSFECMGDNPAAYPQITRQLQEAFTRLVTLDKITNIIKFNYSGHAYDLQTSSGYYLANIISQRQGIILSNCRCHIEVFRDGKWKRGVYDD